MKSVLVAMMLLSVCSLATADVLRVVIDDAIHPISAELLERASQQAAKDHDDVLLVILRTPGGFEDSMRSMVQTILSSRVPVIVYVSPTGSRAASAGFFLLEAADVAAMAPGTNTGAAHPVRADGRTMDPTMRDKVENDSAAFMRTIATKRQRNVAVAESAVRESKSFTEQEALSAHVIDLVTPDETTLLRSVEGRSIHRFDGTQGVIRQTHREVHTFEMSLRERLMSHLMDPNIAFLLLALGGLALAAELNHPGAVLPGVVGCLSLLLAAFALNLMPTRYEAVALILLAFILFALEAKYAAHGVLGIGGAVSMVLGGLFLVDGPIAETRVSLITALSVTLPIALIAIFLMTIAARVRHQPVVTGSEGMIGEIGIARTLIDPEGKVFVHGSLWNARASGSIEAGRRVRVCRVDGLHLIVEPSEA